MVFKPTIFCVRNINATTVPDNTGNRENHALTPAWHASVIYQIL